MLKATARRALSTFIGTLGVRIDKVEGRWWRISAWLIMIAVYYGVDMYWIGASDAPSSALRSLAVWYAFTIWILYYGVTLIGVTKTGANRWLINRFGESRAYLWYEAILGLMFLNQGFTQTVMNNAFDDSLPNYIPEWATVTAAGILILVGTTYKVWAAYVTGLDTYYLRDLFLGRRIEHANGNEDGLVASGPYKYFKNPMYGIGTVHAYGAALWVRSLEGLLLAAIFQCSIYVFYFVAERPFVREFYGPYEPSVPSAA